MSTPTSADGRSPTQHGQPSPETSKNFAHFWKVVLAPRWELFQSGKFFFRVWSVRDMVIRASKIQLLKMRHFWREKNWHVRQLRQVEKNFKIFGVWKITCFGGELSSHAKKKVTLDENQKVKLDIKIGQEDNETKHSFVKRVANSRRFTHTIKGKKFFSTWPGFRMDVRMPSQTQKF